MSLRGEVKVLRDAVNERLKKLDARIGAVEFERQYSSAELVQSRVSTLLTDEGLTYHMTEIKELLKYAEGRGWAVSIGIGVKSDVNT